MFAQCCDLVIWILVFLWSPIIHDNPHVSRLAPLHTARHTTPDRGCTALTSHTITFWKTSKLLQMAHWRSAFFGWTAEMYLWYNIETMVAINASVEGLTNFTNSDIKFKFPDRPIIFCMLWMCIRVLKTACKVRLSLIFLGPEFFWISKHLKKPTLRN